MRRFFSALLKQEILISHGLLIAVIFGIGITLTLRRTDIVSLLASATSSISGDPAIMYFSPSQTTPLHIGETEEIDININARVPVNAIGATISFPPESLEVVGISKEKSFLDLWTEETSIQENDGHVHFSGGTLRKGGLTGVGTALTLTVRAKKSGNANISFSDAQVLAHNETGTYLETEHRSYTISIANDAPREIFINAATITHSAPSADFDSSGAITLADMSNLAFHLLGGYDPLFDLNQDGRLNLSDLSIFFAQIQKGKK